MCKISVIVPVYNTEQYLPRCLDSILSQSFTDFELLLVDDGSTDGSGAICDTYAEKDSRVRVFHKENGGVSSARNVGLTHAQGDWLYFVDSDDELLPDGLLTLVNCIGNDVDVVMGGYEKYDVNGHVVEIVGKTGEIIVLKKKESITSLYHGHALDYYYLGWMWIRMFRNSIIKCERISFDTRLRIKEDTLFTMQYLCRSNGVTRFVNKPVYKYFMRNGSAMGGWREGFDRAYVDSFEALRKMKREIEASDVNCSELSFIAKEGLWHRYVEIKDKIMTSDTSDANVLLKKLRVEVESEGVGVLFLLRKKIRKVLRKWKSRH